MKDLKRFVVGALAAVAIFSLWTVPAPASEPVYLAQPWFHHGPDVNVLTTPAKAAVAVDNEGRYLTDDSIGGKDNRFARLALDSLQACGGEYFVAMQKGGYKGSFAYTYYRIGHRQNGERFLVGV